MWIEEYLTSFETNVKYLMKIKKSPFTYLYNRKFPSIS